MKFMPENAVKDKIIGGSSIPPIVYKYKKRLLLKYFYFIIVENQTPHLHRAVIHLSWLYHRQPASNSA